MIIDLIRPLLAARRKPSRARSLALDWGSLKICKAATGAALGRRTSAAKTERMPRPGRLGQALELLSRLCCISNARSQMPASPTAGVAASGTGSLELTLVALAALVISGTAASTPSGAELGAPASLIGSVVFSAGTEVNAMLRR
jgi:hypothetical protein